jgi:serine/threonine protein kinase
MDAPRPTPQAVITTVPHIPLHETVHSARGFRAGDVVGGAARFAVITSAILALSLLAESLRRFWFGDIHEALRGLAGDELQTEFLALASISGAGFVTWRKRATDSLAVCALIYLGLIFVTSSSQVSFLTGDASLTLRPSWVPVFILLFVLLVPGSLIYHFALLLFTAVLTPVLVGVWLVSHPGVPVRPPAPMEAVGANRGEPPQGGQPRGPGSDRRMDDRGGGPPSPPPGGFREGRRGDFGGPDGFRRRGGPPTMHTRAALLRRMLIDMGPTWTSVIIGAALAMHRTRERNRWRQIADELKTARSRIKQLGAYALERRLGKGGMGEVWQATHQALARPAAIKLISPHLLGTDDPESEASQRLFQRFEQEAKITARLTSPHTVQVYDYGQTDDGRIYYVMELLNGVDLERIARATGPLSPDRVASLMLDVCDSLAEAHSFGLVHRDIKPANLVLCRQGLRRETVKVVDFGLAAARTTRATAELSDTVTGSPHYMSPEQIRDVEVDGRSDLYSLGCVAWRLLTGRELFGEESDSTVLRRHLETPPPSLHEACGRSLDPRFTHLIESMLAKRPEERPDNAEAVAVQIRTLGWPEPTSPLLTPDLLDTETEYIKGGTMVITRQRAMVNPRD